jgi:hypothetical protein
VSTVAVASAQLNDEHCGNSAKRENENIMTPDEIAAVCPSVFIRIVAEAIGHICCHIIARGRLPLFRLAWNSECQGYFVFRFNTTGK